MRKLRIVFILSVLAAEIGCIGRQPAQQGTWSKQDGFKTKVSDQAGHSPQSPDKG